EGGIFYLSAAGNVSRLNLKVSKVRGLAVSPDAKILYIASGNSPEIIGCSLESAGLPGRAAVLCKLHGADSTSAPAVDLAVDGRGMLFVLNGTARTIEIFTSLGTRVGTAALPETPVACALGGRDRQTLFILTRNAILTMDVASADPSATVRKD